MISSYSISKCCTASWFSQGKNVELTCTNWGGAFSSISLTSIFALCLSNDHAFAFLLYLAASCRGVYYFYSLLWCPLYNWATVLPCLCCCIIQKSVKVFLCLNPLLSSLPYVRLTVSLPACYHSIKQCEEVFVLLHPLIQCLDCALLTILIFLRCWSMQQCEEVLGLLHLLLQDSIMFE